MFFNGIDNGIEEKHHWLASPHDAMNTNLISQDPDTGTLTWYGDVCVHCGDPRRTSARLCLHSMGQLSLSVRIAANICRTSAKVCVGIRQGSSITRRTKS